LTSIPGTAIREKGRKWFDLDNGVRSYTNMYKTIFNGTGAAAPEKVKTHNGDI
jgi:hypothetical protein